MIKNNDKNSMQSNPFHAGEVSFQERLGVSEELALIAKKAIHDHMPEGHQVFFSMLPMVFVAAEDDNNDLWSSVLIGARGFLQFTNDKNFTINAQFSDLDPLSNMLSKESQIGLLGIEFEKRRRNRVSAKISSTTDSSFSLEVKQCHGNCPKYIQKREGHKTQIDAVPESKAFDVFNDEIKLFVHTSDTLFIASQHIEDNNHNHHGVDSSHRGGMPGFSQVVNDKTLLIPDYIGNNFFNTMGNISLNSKVGIQYVDFENGHRLLLTGTAEVIWADDQDLPFDGVDRMIKFTLKKGYLLKNSLPYTWDFKSYSPFSKAYLPES